MPPAEANATKRRIQAAPTRRLLMQLLPDDQPQLQLTNRYDAPILSDEEFHAFRELILSETGISLSVAKRELLRSRLLKRLLRLKLSTFTQYYHLIRHGDSDGTELIELINSVTTNKTDFFREAHHFSFLEQQAFPEFADLARASGSKKLRIWSAACSTGEEPYSIAATVNNFFANRNWDIRILASDIDSNCLQIARQAVYAEDQIEQIPHDQKKRMFLKGTGTNAGLVRIRPELRESVTCRRINFADDAWSIRTKFDVIFCRNVMIYFNRAFQDRLLRQFLKYLQPHGYLILGHSENVTWMDEFEPIGQTTYRKKSWLRTHTMAQNSTWNSQH